ncbi:MAG TPA: hypothetical protein VF806_00370 [Anaerolineaceae bacterium]
MSSQSSSMRTRVPNEPRVPQPSSSSSGKRPGIVILGGLLALGGILAGMVALQAPANSSTGQFVTWLFATNSVQVMWYITRAAGLTSYLVLWLSVAWGLAVSSKILDNMLHRTFTYDFHQFISLLAIGFILIHMISLMFDHYLPYSAAQLLIPGLSTYRPIWVAVGIVAFYLTMLVTVTFYMRGKIGMKAFRSIHTLSLVAYLGSTIHGLLSGTDASLFFVQAMYAGTFLVTVFLMAYWLIMLGQKNRARQSEQRASTSQS